VEGPPFSKGKRRGGPGNSKKGRKNKKVENKHQKHHNNYSNGGRGGKDWETQTKEKKATKITWDGGAISPEQPTSTNGTITLYLWERGSTLATAHVEKNNRRFLKRKEGETQAWGAWQWTQ